MISFTTEGIILRSRDVGSYDRVYTVYTKDRGKLMTRAISIRKAESKLQSSMNPHALLALYIIAQRRFTLGGAVIIERFQSFSEHLVLQWLHQHFRELVDLLTRPEYHDEELFRLVVSFLRQQRPTCTLEEAILQSIAFDLRCVQHLGLLPDIQTEQGKRLFLKPALAKGIQTHVQFDVMLQAHDAQLTQKNVSLSDALHAYAVVQSFIQTTDVEPLKSDGLLKQLAGSKTLR